VQFPSSEEEALAAAGYQDGAGEVPFPEFSAWVARLDPTPRRYVLRTLELVAGAVGDVGPEVARGAVQAFAELGRTPMTVREKELLTVAFSTVSALLNDLARVARG
jgi:hypothetical protein